jgi:predicted HTH transcriptional regulator
MVPFQKPVEEIEESDLLALISNGAMEGKTLEYKRDRIGQSDNDKKEFLYDVSSFANAAGGYLVLGLAEKDGLPIAVPGLTGINPDEEITRLQQIVRDGIRPPILGLQFAAIPLKNGAAAIVIQIPKSWNPPHQVTYQKMFRFYGRDLSPFFHPAMSGVPG